MKHKNPHIIIEKGVEFPLGTLQGNTIQYDFKRILIYLDALGRLVLTVLFMQNKICVMGLKTDLSKKLLRIKEAVGHEDKKLFERSEFFLSVEEGSVVFFYDFLVSLDFFGSFLCQDKNEHNIKEPSL